MLTSRAGVALRVGIVSVLLLSSAAAADPIHDHCIREGIPWSFTINNPRGSFEAGGADDHTLVFANLLLPVNPPPSPTASLRTSSACGEELAAANRSCRSTAT